MFFFVFFFFKQKTAYEMRISDWSSDVCSSDLSGRVWRDDHINKIRFFSTFHIGPNNFEAYWRALQDFQPDYLVGFPSSVLDLCAMAQERGLQYSGKRSEEHTSELQSLMRISYAVFCLKKKK